MAKLAKTTTENTKFKTLSSPQIDYVEWFDDNYTVAIQLTGTLDGDCRQGATPAVKKGEELFVEFSFEEAEFLFEELRRVLTQRAYAKYKTYEDMDRAYAMNEFNISEEEYQSK